MYLKTLPNILSKFLKLQLNFFRPRVCLSPLSGTTSSNHGVLSYKSLSSFRDIVRTVLLTRIQKKEDTEYSLFLVIDMEQQKIKRHPYALHWTQEFYPVSFPESIFSSEQKHRRGQVLGESNTRGRWQFMT